MVPSDRMDMASLAMQRDILVDNSSALAKAVAPRIPCWNLLVGWLEHGDLLDGLLFDGDLYTAALRLYVDLDLGVSACAYHPS